MLSPTTFSWKVVCATQTAKDEVLAYFARFYQGATPDSPLPFDSIVVSDLDVTVTITQDREYAT